MTPNLYDDGHNTDIRTSCAWTRGFVESLLQNPYFNKNALIYVTWQANGNQPGLANHVAGIILGSALPKELHGAKDHNYYVCTRTVAKRLKNVHADSDPEPLLSHVNG